MLKALALHLHSVKNKFYALSAETGATKVDSWIDIEGGIGNIFTNASLTTLPIEFTQDAARTSIRRKRIAQAVIGVKDGIAVKLGSAGELHIWNVNSDFSLDPVQTTQRLRVFPTGYNDDATISVTASVPVPITILSLAYRVAY